MNVISLRDYPSESLIFCKVSEIQKISQLYNWAMMSYLQPTIISKNSVQHQKKVLSNHAPPLFPQACSNPCRSMASHKHTNMI